MDRMRSACSASSWAASVSRTPRPCRSRLHGLDEPGAAAAVAGAVGNLRRANRGGRRARRNVAGGFAALAYIAYVSTLVGFGAWGWLMRRYDAGLVAMYSLLVPPFGLASARQCPPARTTHGARRPDPGPTLSEGRLVSVRGLGGRLGTSPTIAGIFPDVRRAGQPGPSKG
jgi:hypothetical protein